MVVTGSMNGKLKTCPFCKFESHSLIKISDHLRTYHYNGSKNNQGTQEFACEKCPQRVVFGSMQMLRNHCHLVHTSEKFAKTKRRKKMNSSEKLVKTKCQKKMTLRHKKKPTQEMTQSPNAQVKCELCDFVFKHKNSRNTIHNLGFVKRRHMINMHFKDQLNAILPQTYPFQCPECDYEGEVKSHLFGHYLNKHDLYDKFLAQALASQKKSRACLHCKANSSGMLCTPCLWKFNPVIFITEEDQEIVTLLKKANVEPTELLQGYVDNVIDGTMSIVTNETFELQTENETISQENSEHDTFELQTENETTANGKPVEPESVNFELQTENETSETENVTNATFELHDEILEHEKLEERDFEDVSIMESSPDSSACQELNVNLEEPKSDTESETISQKTLEPKIWLKTLITKLKSQRKWQCRHCFKKFKSKKNYKTHMKWMHDKFKRITCPKCPEKFYEKLLFVSHFKMEHRGSFSVNSQESPIQEPQKETEETFQSQFVINNAETSTPVENPVQYDMLPMAFHGCDKCPQTFPDAVQLHEHAKTHNMTSSLMKMKTERVQMQVYRCALCAFFTHSSSDMISHSFQNHIIVQDVTFDVETVE